MVGIQTVLKGKWQSFNGSYTFPLISMKGKNMMEWIGITWELEVARGLNIGQDGDQGHSYIIFLTAWIPRIRLFEEYNPLAF